jgi:hypothetical protein
MGTRGHTKEQYHSFGSSYCIDFESQDELHCNFAVLDDFDAWWILVGCRVWTSHVGLELELVRRWTRTKTNNYCDWSSTKVLAVLIALTLKVKMNCIAILALLCCT